MDLYGLATDILCYITLAVMLCAEMRECQQTGSSGPLVEFINWQLIIAKA